MAGKAAKEGVCVIDTRRNVWTNQYLMVMYAVSQEIRVVVVLYIANIEDLRMIKSDQ